MANNFTKQTNGSVVVTDTGSNTTLSFVDGGGIKSITASNDGLFVNLKNNVGYTLYSYLIAEIGTINGVAKPAATSDLIAALGELFDQVSSGGGGGGGGDASAANQITGNNTLSAINTKIPAQGQAIAASSSPVVIASDQSALPIKTTVKTFVDVPVTATGSSQVATSANAAGYGIQLGNPSGSSTIWFNNSGGTAAVNGAGCFPLFPGGMYEDRLTNGVNIIQTSGQPVTVKTY